MGGAVEAGKLCHLVDFQPEVVQVLLRLFNPGVVDVLLHGNPQVFLEQAAEIRLTDHQVVGDLIERDVAAAQILPDIIRRLANQVVFFWSRAGSPVFNPFWKSSRKRCASSTVSQA